MAGLVPAIHVERAANRKLAIRHGSSASPDITQWRDVDGRDKPGHDGSYCLDQQ